MTNLRVWQNVEKLDKVHNSVIHCVEIDLATSYQSEQFEMQYNTFSPENPIQIMYDFARYLSDFGPQAPKARSILVIRKSSEGSLKFSNRYPGFDFIEYLGNTILSANVAEVAMIRMLVENEILIIKNKRPVLKEIKDERVKMINLELADLILKKLWNENRILFYPGGKSDVRTNNAVPSSIDLIVPFNDRSSYLTEESKKLESLLSFNAGYFILPEEEFNDPFTFATDTIGLTISNHKVLSAPIYKRTALIFTDTVYRNHVDESIFSLKSSRPYIRLVGLENYAVNLVDDIIVAGESVNLNNPFFFHKKINTAKLNSFDPQNGDNVIFYNRLYGLDQVLRYTPESNRIEFVIVEDQICAIKEGGNTYIPPHGFVISFPNNNLSRLIRDRISQKDSISVTQFVDFGTEIVSPKYGVQVGPRILENGNPININEQFQIEDYYYTDYGTDDGIPPIHLKPDRFITDDYPIIAFGIREDNRCFVVFIEGCESRSYVEEFDSYGGSLKSVSELLKDLGCKNAVLLDGGGSAQIVYKSKLISRASDRHDVLLTPMERIVGGGWMVFAKK